MRLDAEGRVETDVVRASEILPLGLLTFAHRMYLDSEGFSPRFPVSAPVAVAVVFSGLNRDSVDSVSDAGSESTEVGGEPKFAGRFRG